MDELINLIKTANWQAVLAMFPIGWYFTKDLRKEMHELRNDMKEQRKRVDRLYQLCLEIQLKDRK